MIAIVQSHAQNLSGSQNRRKQVYARDRYRFRVFSSKKLAGSPERALSCAEEFQVARVPNSSQRIKDWPCSMPNSLLCLRENSPMHARYLPLDLSTETRLLERLRLNRTADLSMSYMLIDSIAKRSYMTMPAFTTTFPSLNTYLIPVGATSGCS